MKDDENKAAASSSPSSSPRDESSKKSCKSSSSSSTSSELPIPILYENEVKEGKDLGSGAFCHVGALKKIVLRESTTLSEDDHMIQLRQVFASKFEKDPPPVDRMLAIYGKPSHSSNEMDDAEVQAPRLAVKRIREDELAAADLQIAKQDLKRELEILLAIASKTTAINNNHASSSSPFHPNIIELHAIGIHDWEDISNKKNSYYYDDMKLSQPPSFLILSQIKTTLTRRFLKWREQRGLGLYEIFSIDITSTRNLWVERLVVMARAADAIRHLHSKRILYRDMKPGNIGFDTQDIPKLFDFGLSKRIPSPTSEGHHDDTGLYKLTGDTGTRLYMAPEVALNRPYGWTADVYSLAILFYEILTLKNPYHGVSSSNFEEEVWVGGERPPLDHSWPPKLQSLLERMWQAQPRKRPSAEEVSLTLEEMLRGSDDALFPSHMIVSRRRRSIF